MRDRRGGGVRSGFAVLAKSSAVRYRAKAFLPPTPALIWLVLKPDQGKVNRSEGKQLERRGWLGWKHAKVRVKEIKKPGVQNHKLYS